MLPFTRVELMRLSLNKTVHDHCGWGVAALGPRWQQDATTAKGVRCSRWEVEYGIVCTIPTFRGKDNPHFGQNVTFGGGRFSFDCFEETSEFHF